LNGVVGSGADRSLHREALNRKLAMRGYNIDYIDGVPLKITIDALLFYEDSPEEYPLVEKNGVWK
jgi:uncharacterized lipoprotein YajG